MKTKVWAASVCIMLSALNPCRATENSEQYREQLEKTLYEDYFPPRGGWEYSEASAQARLNCNGTFRDFTIVEHPRNRYVKGNPTSKLADMAIKIMFDAHKPLKPPKEFGCPVKLLVRIRVNDPKSKPHFLQRVEVSKVGER